MMELHGIRACQARLGPPGDVHTHLTRHKCARLGFWKGPGSRWPYITTSSSPSLHLRKETKVCSGSVLRSLTGLKTSLQFSSCPCHRKCDRAENMTVTGNQLDKWQNISVLFCDGAKGTHFPRQKNKKKWYPLKRSIRSRSKHDPLVVTVGQGVHEHSKPPSNSVFKNQDYEYSKYEDSYVGQRTECLRQGTM